MNGVTNTNSSTMLAAGGAGFLALAGFFLLRDLALPPAFLLVAVALVASIGAPTARPRRWPWLAPGALLALSVGGGSWYLLVKSPALLPALAATAVGATAAVVRQERRSPDAASTAAGELTWYAAAPGSWWRAARCISTF